MEKKYRNTFWALLIPILVLAYIFFGGSVGISLDFGEEALTVGAEKQSWNIPYAQITSLELAEAVDYGDLLEGTQRKTLQYGRYQNSLWGTYTLCIDPRIDMCIVIATTEGFWVLNYETEDATEQLYAMFTQLLAAESESLS